MYHSIDRKRISHMIYHTEIRSNMEGRGRNMYVNDDAYDLFRNIISCRIQNIYHARSQQKVFIIKVYS